MLCIFVADADDAHVAVVAEILRAEGFSVRLFADGATLLAALLDPCHNASLVLLDLMMPSGERELLTRLASVPALPPIVIVSAVEEFSPPSVMPPISAYVLKPTNRFEIMSAVRRVLGSMTTPKVSYEDAVEEAEESGVPSPHGGFIRH